MAPEAPEVGGELGAARGARLVGHHLAGCRAQVRDQILEVATVDVAAKRRHAMRGRFHAGAIVGVLALPAGGAVEHVLAEVAGVLDEHHLRLAGERRHGTLLAARIANPAVALGTMTPEATERCRNPPTARRGRVLDREHLSPHDRVGEPGGLEQRERDQCPRDERMDARSPHSRPRLTAGCGTR